MGRPTTRYLSPSRPGTGNERNTRSANGAASRLASPRCASASSSASGIRCACAASATGPATYPPPPRTTSGRRRRTIVRHFGTAAAASATAFTSRRPGRRGSPSTRNCSNSKPAAGTSVASARSAPAKTTSAPRALSDSATASAGITCPAVPPAAIRHTGWRFDCCMVDGDVKEDPDGGQHDDQTRPAVGDERERDPGQRREAEDGGEIDQRLPRDERRDARGEQLPERVAAPERDIEAGPAEHDERGHDRPAPDEPELLA